MSDNEDEEEELVKETSSMNSDNVRYNALDSVKKQKTQKKLDEKKKIFIINALEEIDRINAKIMNQINYLSDDKIMDLMMKSFEDILNDPMKTIAFTTVNRTFDTIINKYFTIYMND